MRSLIVLALFATAGVLALLQGTEHTGQGLLALILAVAAVAVWAQGRIIERASR